VLIVDDLLEEAKSGLSTRRIADVRIGLGYTAVLLDDESCGLSATTTEGAHGCCTLFDEAGELVGRSAIDVGGFVRLPDPVASCVGMATINAVLNREGIPSPNPLQVLSIDDAVVGMVGYFEPFIPELRRRSKQLYVFERRPLSDEVLPDWSAERLLPTCEVAIITSLALVNETLDHLLDLAQGEVALIGPTTPSLASPCSLRSWASVWQCGN